jgi:hypothetical protein
VVFGLALIWVYTNINWITGSNIRSAAERIIPVLEASDEEPTVNRSEDHTPKPVLLPASTETLPVESIDMATDPQASEAVEVALQKPFAEAAGQPADPVVPAAKSPRFGSLPTESTPAISREDPAQPPEDLYGRPRNHSRQIYQRTREYLTNRRRLQTRPHHRPLIYRQIRHYPWRIRRTLSNRMVYLDLGTTRTAPQR